jgi:hypothetical protein
MSINSITLSDEEGQGERAQHEQAVHLVLHQGGYPADPAGHHGQPGCYALHQHRRQLLVPGGQHQQIAVPQHRRDLGVGEEPGEAHSPGQRPGLPLGGLPVRAIAHDEQARRFPDLAEGLHQRADVLLPGDPADVGHTGPGQVGERVGRDGGEQVRVIPRRDDPDPAFWQAFAQETVHGRPGEHDHHVRPGPHAAFREAARQPQQGGPRRGHPQRVPHARVDGDHQRAGVPPRCQPGQRQHREVLPAVRVHQTDQAAVTERQPRRRQCPGLPGQRHVHAGPRHLPVPAELAPAG